MRADLMSFMRRADVVKVACLAQMVNVIAPILTRPDRLLLQMIYYPFALIAGHAAGVSLTPAITCATYVAGERGEAPVLDAAASYDAAAGAVALFLINRDQQRDLLVEVDLAGRRLAEDAHVQLLGGGDMKATNTWEAPHRVVPVTGQALPTEVGGLQVRVPAPGLAVVSAGLTA